MLNRIFRLVHAFFCHLQSVIEAENMNTYAGRETSVDAYIQAARITPYLKGMVSGRRCPKYILFNVNDFQEEFGEGRQKKRLIYD